MGSPQMDTNGATPDGTDHEFGDIMTYSRNMTESLFGNQIYTYPDGLSIPDTRTAQRREVIKRTKAKDQYGDLVEQLVKSSHPLARPRKNNQNNSETTQRDTTTTTAPELSIVLKDTRKTVAQTRIESVAKSARALVIPWMNAIDKKSHALDEIVRPEWHAPWKLYRVLSPPDGGWVHSIAVDPSNMWFASGCGAGLIRIWDIASGRRRITLTGHISGVRGLCVSERHPYLFSCGEDKKVICWDLEQNQAIRNFHGHLSGVYSLAMHPTENLLVTGGRDSVARVWDMRTKEQVFCLTGHTNTVGAIQCLENDPQIITGSNDTTIRFWDLKAGKTLTTLTHHKKSVRALAMRHDKTGFASGANDNIKQWSLPDGKFIQNLSGHDEIINCLAANKDNVLVSGSNNSQKRLEQLFFWDWRTGYNFQRLASLPQAGSIESEACILALTFDRSGARLIAGKSDKTIRMYREDPNASEDTHPIDWKPDIKQSRF